MDKLREVFTRLRLILDGAACIKFADPEVKRICVNQWDENKNGDIDIAEAKISRVLPRIFNDNTVIRTFDEFKHFNISPLYDNNFTNCKSLKSISLPKSYTIIKYRDFKGTALEYIEFPDTLTTIGGEAFKEVSTLKEISIPESVTSIGGNAFYGTGISQFVYPPGIINIDGLGNNLNLTYVEIKGRNVTLITGMGDCPLLETLIIRTSIPPETNYWTLRNSKIPNIYVPDESVNAYKTSSSWNKWAASIKPMSEKP